MRRAVPDDAPDIARLIRALWPDNNPDPDRIARVILETNHVTLVEEDGDRLIGFLDAFSTISADGVLRWEVDLLGVHPAQRGRGIARALVGAAAEAGRAFGAQVARALVRVDNAASLRVFEHCGFTAHGTEVDLYVSDRGVTSAAAPPPNAYLLSVTTLTYSGVWVEGMASPESLRAAQAVRSRFRWDIAGAVVPAGTAAVGYELAGRYCWLERALG